MTENNIIYRQLILPEDPDTISSIIESSGFFSTEEIVIARELAEEKLSHGSACSYQFLFAEKEDSVCGYTCYGLIPATTASYDLYWIAVNEAFRGKGLGKALMERTENIIESLSGKRIYVETSSRDQYKPTHIFYESCGYKKEAFLKDFYGTGDSKIVYVKSL